MKNYKSIFVFILCFSIVFIGFIMGLMGLIGFFSYFETYGNRCSIPPDIFQTEYGVFPILAFFGFSIMAISSVFASYILKNYVWDSNGNRGEDLT